MFFSPSKFASFYQTFFNNHRKTKKPTIEKPHRFTPFSESDELLKGTAVIFLYIDPIAINNNSRLKTPFNGRKKPKRTQKNNK